jgi:DNA processing protein
LIRQGAKLVESLEDIVEEFPDLAPSSARPAGAEVADPRPTPADAFGAALAYDPVTLDALCACSGMSADAASAALLQLELAGAVERLPGNRYRRLG